MILGIVGKKRHGKDTVARVLWETDGFNRIAFGDELKRTAMGMYDLSFAQCYDDVLKEQVDERWGLSPRFILQKLGTEVAREIHIETWSRAVFIKIDKARRGEPIWMPNFSLQRFELTTITSPEHWAIPDSRYQTECDAVMATGEGVLLRVHRPGMPDTDTHSSEKAQESIKVHHTIINDSTLDVLESRAARLPLFLGR